MTHRELEELTQGLVDHSLTGEELARLQETLTNDAAARDFFRKSMEVELLLDEAVGQPLETRASASGMDQMLRRRRKRDVTRATLLTAAILVIAAVVMTFIMIKPPPPPSLVCDLVPGTEWEVLRNSDPSELKVTEGSTVRVRSGTLRMTLDSGAVMLLRGPAEARFPKLHEPVLQHGWLWIDSADGAESFAIRTPDLIIRNMGTRFGVRVPEYGPAEVHLVTGDLQVTRSRKKEKPLTLNPSGHGLLIPSLGTVSKTPLSPDPFPGLPELLNARASYRTTVLSQGPGGYWSLDTPDQRDLENEISEGRPGYRGNSALPGKPGVGTAGLFEGFPKSNRAIALTGDLLTSVITKIDIPGSVSRKEGGVSFWIRRPPHLEHDEILWLAGKTPKNVGSFPREAFIHTRISSSGRIEFFVENGKFDVLLSSNFSVADDSWHHIAASWGPSAIELYVDGKRVERADDFGSLKPGLMQGEYVRFGKPSADLIAEGKKPFAGLVDEIAIWNRPLGATEIARQYQAADRKK